MQFAQLDNCQPEAPVSSRFADVYFSREGGLAETRHVFLHGNDLPERWQQLSRPWFTIGETGFGTGLNFLATWQAWRDSHQQGRLHFISTELYPIHPDQLPAILQPLRSELPVADDFIPAWQNLVPGWNRFSFSDAELTLWIGDATAGLQDCQATVDAWYLDGFAPSRNAALWQPSLYEAMANLSYGATTLATYTVARAVRDGLDAAGFRVDKRPGFGRKRHCLGGRFEGFHGPLPPPQTLWWPRPEPVHAGPIAVIGSGIAAAELAQRCQRRGLDTTVIAPGAPEHPVPEAVQAAVYAKPGLEADPATCWYAAALSYRLRQWTVKGQYWPGQRTGVLQLMPEARWQRLRDTLPDHPFGQLVTPLTAEEASACAGTPLQQPGLWFTGAGWLAPRPYIREQVGLCRLIDSQAVDLQPISEGWRITDDSGREHDFAAVIIAAGMGSKSWPVSAHLPLKPVRGQLTGVSGPPGPDCVICGERYVTPAGTDGTWHFGATFQPGEADYAIRDEDQDANQQALQRLAPELAERVAGAPKLTAAAGVRATTPDYLPLAGPLLRRETREQPPRWPLLPVRPDYQPGLYVLSGLGSKGLASSALLAEYVICQLTGEPLPFGREMEKRLHAERQWLRGRHRH